MPSVFFLQLPRSLCVSMHNVPCMRTASQSQCGNGIINVGEECDDSNAVDLDGCSQCQLDPFFMCQAAWRHPETPNQLGYMVFACSRMGCCVFVLGNAAFAVCTIEGMGMYFAVAVDGIRIPVTAVYQTA